MAEAVRTTVLNAAHRAAGGRMVPFAGYEMPVQYAGPEGGVLAEHRWTREHAGLFDVSHMGPAWLALHHRSGDGEADHRAVAAIVETLVCGDIAGLKPGQLRYTLLMAEDGGILDDLMIGRPAEAERQGSLYIVVNSGTKDADFIRIGKAAGERAELVRADDGGLLALQGPEAVAAASAIWPEADTLSFMTFRTVDTPEGVFTVARSGYTGEDGVEVLAPAEVAPRIWDRLLSDDRVRPVGLGARDSLRLEAGLPLYGHDIDETTSPVEANLAFAVSKRRREEGGFPGSERVLRELREGPTRLRVGLRLPAGGAPAREGATVVREFSPEAGPEVVEPSSAPGSASGSAPGGAHHLGVITSGGPSPSLGGGVAMAYLPYDHREPGTPVQVVVRGRVQTAEVAPMPFHPHRYHRKPPKTGGA